MLKHCASPSAAFDRREPAPAPRVWKFGDGFADLVAGARFRFDRNPAQGDATRVALPHPELFDAARPGDALLVDGGRLRFRVLSATRDVIDTEITRGGEILDREGVRLEAGPLSVAH
ncbi:pyruvate kinase [Crenobacter luteus]|uniref:Uncharacterized protein n=1 Tax=Crenobacter luteus TaxID=1452487 RepID=A0A165F2Y9_9NEIS|nr:pyruvate kinase [Crenobacter luteus]KZE30310.1 hypothetical protein AVW16_12495 [Crenobacter luteus]